MSDIYQLWMHRPSGKVYVVWLASKKAYKRIESACCVVGVCGPLDPLSISFRSNLAAYSYDCSPAAQEVLANREEFTVHLL